MLLASVSFSDERGPRTRKQLNRFLLCRMEPSRYAGCSSFHPLRNESRIWKLLYKRSWVYIILLLFFDLGICKKSTQFFQLLLLALSRHSRDHSVLSSLADQNRPKKTDQKTWGLNIFDWFPLSFGPNWWQRLKSMLWNCHCYGPFSWQQGGNYDGCKSTHDAPMHPPTVDASEFETNFFKEMFLHFSFWLILSHWFVWSFLLNPRRCRSNIYIAAPQMSPGGDGEPGD